MNVFIPALVYCVCVNLNVIVKMNYDAADVESVRL